MIVPRIPARKIRIEANSCGKISPDDIRQLIDIVMVYFPDREETSEIVHHHIRHADSLRIARDRNNTVAGFSVASSCRQLTPFYPRPIHVLYQRMLYLAPGILYRGLGKRLLVATFRDLLGPLWAFRRFAVVCRTLNPVVARMMDMHTVSYPHFGEQLPAEIRKFGESLVPMLGATGLDEQCRLIGTLEALKNTDYTDIWNRHLKRHDNSYEKLMLSSAFTERNGRIINSGAFVLMVAYSRPLQFARFLFH